MLVYLTMKIVRLKVIPGYQLNHLRLSATYMCRWTGSTLIQIMACHLFGAKPLPEPMMPYCQLISWEQTSVKFESKYNKANLRDLIATTGLVISNWIQIVNFSDRVTVKFDGWPCKTIGHLFYATSSFVHHFIAIGEFKLELQSGNAQSGSNSTIFRAVRPWNLTDDLAKQ